jgi:hypothetical protein
VAYANYLASVEWTEIASLRKGLRTTIAPQTVAAVSHLLAGAGKEQPLGGCLAEVIDRGEVLSPLLWHPLRVPLVHSPDAAALLATKMQTALESLHSSVKNKYVLDYEIAGIVRVLADAANNNRGVISVLEPPADEDHAQRVVCPFSEPDKLPIPWGNLGKTLKRFVKP